MEMFQLKFRRRGKHYNRPPSLLTKLKLNSSSFHPRLASTTITKVCPFIANDYIKVHRRNHHDTSAFSEILYAFGSQSSSRSCS